MKQHVTAIGGVVGGALALWTYSHSQPTPAKPAAAVKIAVVAMRDAMLSTKEGQKAGKDLQAKFEPRTTALQKLAQELQTGGDQLQKGAATMAADARQRLNDDLVNKKKRYDRDAED